MKPTDLRRRIRGYEDAFRYSLPGRLPVIIRLDGKSFHTLTKKFEKPYDALFIKAMDHVAYNLLKEIQNAKVAYVQSDEITLVLINYANYKTQSWFKNEVQKMVSVSASIATLYFNQIMNKFGYKDIKGMFDSRVFVVPREEVSNVIIDRWKDCERNFFLNLGQYYLGKKEINGISCCEIEKRLYQCPSKIEELDLKYLRYGRFLYPRKEEAWFCDSIKRIRDVIDEIVWPHEEEGAYSERIF